MNNLNSRALASILIFLFLLSLLEYKLSLVPNSYNWKRQRLCEQSPQIKCLILGSSHSYYGINPDEFSLKAINLANASQSLVLDTAIIKQFINQLPQLQVIILPISSFSLEYKLLDSPEDWRDCYSLRFLGVSEAPWWQVLTQPKYLSLTWLYGPVKIRDLLTHNFAVSYAQNISASGWYCGDDKHLITNEAAAARVKINENCMKPKNLTIIHSCLEEVLALCNHRNIKVIFVTIPVHPYYFQNMDINRWAQSQTIIRAFCQKYNCVYLDHIQDKSFTDSDFRDTDHLSKTGAIHFSKLLNKNLPALAL